MKFKSFIFIIFVYSFTFAQNVNNSILLSNEDFIAGDDGTLRMYVNVIGHVVKPGTYLLYDGIDIMTALSAAGGFRDGSKLNDVIIYSKDGKKARINLNSLYDNEISNLNIILKPHDTIIVKQKSMHKIFTSSNLPQILLTMLNVALTIERTE